MNNLANWLLNNVFDPLVGWLDSYLQFLSKLPLMYYQMASVAVSAMLIYVGIVHYEVAKVITATESIPSIVSQLTTEGHGGNLTGTEFDVLDMLAAINTFFPLDELCAMMVVLSNLYIIFFVISIAIKTINVARSVVMIVAELCA